jgi:hypothetical protein
LRNGWPLGEFFNRGYAFVVVYQQNLVGHNEVGFLSGIHPLFYKNGQSSPKANELGGESKFFIPSPSALPTRK